MVDRSAPEHPGTFPQPLPPEVLAHLNILRTAQPNSRCLYDGAIRTEDGEEIPVHLFLMYLSSRLFASDLESGKRLLHLTETDARVARMVIDYVYTNTCPLTESNVDRVFRCACLHEIDSLELFCLDFYKETFRPHHVFEQLRVGQRFHCHELVQAASLYACKHFHEIYQTSSEFTELGVDELRNFLSDDRLNARSEESVFSALVRWVQTDAETRREDLPMLLPVIRFGLVSLPFFMYVIERHKLIESNASCGQVLIEARAHLQGLETSRRDQVLTLDFSLPISRPRIPHEVLYTLGGWCAGSPTSMVEVFDPRANSWYMIEDAEIQPRAYHGLEVVRNLIYVIGGFDGTEHYNSVRTLDPATRMWSHRSCMYHTRCYVSTCVLEDQIYAVGGFDGRTRLNTVERYNPDKNQWEMLPPMRRQRSDAGAAALDGKVYVAGGFNGVEVTSSVECFDPRTREWTYARAMSQMRSGVALVTYRGALYALGGFNGHHRMASVERFDPETGEWQPSPAMGTPRSNFAAVVVDDMIFVIGGFNGASTINHVECFDASTNAWHDVAELNINRSAMAACILEDPSGSYSYTHSRRVSGGSTTAPFLPNPSAIASAFRVLDEEDVLELNR